MSTLRIAVPQTRESLAKLLLEHGVDIKSWDAKFPNIFSKFLTDLNNNEFYLEVGDKGLVRVLNGINAYIYFKEGECVKRLVEDRQEYTDPDGTIRTERRGFEYLSEKIRIGEEPVVALKRGLSEELGVNEGDYQYEFVKEFSEEKESFYYPGLKTKFTFFVYEVWFKPQAFVKEGYTEIDGHRKTYFLWVS